MRRVRVLAVDDERPALDELVFLLGGDPRVGAVGSQGLAPTALRVLRTSRSTRCCSTSGCPGLNGLELARVLAQFNGRCRRSCS